MYMCMCFYDDEFKMIVFVVYIFRFDLLFCIVFLCYVFGNYVIFINKSWFLLYFCDLLINIL